MENRKIISRSILFVFIILTIAPVHADRVLFPNGTFATGKIENATDDYVIFTAEDGNVRKIARTEIVQLVYGDQQSSQSRTANQGSPGLTLFNFITLRNFTGALTLGWQKLPLTDLNSELGRYGYQQAPENFFTIGGVGQVTISRIVLGLEGSYLWGAGKEAQIGSNTIKNSFSALKAVGIIGFLIYTSERLDIFPYIGAGLGGYNLMMTNAQSDSFGNIISTGQRGAVISSASLLIITGIQLTYRIPVLKADKGVFGLALGVKGGYDISFAQSDWYVGGINDFIPVTGGPRTPLSGPYAQGIIGIWFDFF